MHAAEYAIVLALAWLLRRLPYKAALSAGSTIGDVLYLAMKKRREITLSNLEKAFPEKSRNELETAAKKLFRHLGKCAVEFVWLPKMRRDFITKIVKIEGSEN